MLDERFEEARALDASALVVDHCLDPLEYHAVLGKTGDDRPSTHAGHGRVEFEPEAVTERARGELAGGGCAGDSHGVFVHVVSSQRAAPIAV
jgi:hypothetical protein